MSRKDFLSIADLAPEEVRQIVRDAGEMKTGSGTSTRPSGSPV